MIDVVVMVVRGSTIIRFTVQTVWSIFVTVDPPPVVVSVVCSVDTIVVVTVVGSPFPYTSNVLSPTS